MTFTEGFSLFGRVFDLLFWTII